MKNGAIERKKKRYGTFKNGQGSYKDQIHKKIQLPIQDGANCRMYHTYSW